MKQFCRLFFKEDNQLPIRHDVVSCPQCKAAWDEIQEDEKILAQLSGPIYHRSALEVAALDAKGRP